MYRRARDRLYYFRVKTFRFTFRNDTAPPVALTRVFGQTYMRRARKPVAELRKPYFRGFGEQNEENSGVVRVSAFHRRRERKISYDSLRP